MALAGTVARGRRIVMGGVNLFLLAYVAFVLGVNFYHHPVRVDLSANSMNTLSDDTRTCLRALSVPVEVILSVAEDNPRKLGQTVRIVARAEDILRQMTLASDKIKVVDVINVFQRGEAWLRLKDRYQLSGPNRLTLISGGRRQDVRMEDMAELQYGAEGVPRILSFRVERAITGALRRLQGEPRKIYFLRNDGIEGRVGPTMAETTPTGFRELAAELEAGNYDVKELDLKAAGAVPRDCDVLMAVGLIGPLPDEVPAILDYLDAGGRFFFAVNPAVGTEHLSFLKEWGFAIEPAWMVMQARVAAVPVQTERILATEPNVVHPIARKFDANDFRLSLVFARPIGAVAGKYAEREALVSTKGDTIWGERKIDDRPWSRDPNDFPSPACVAGVSALEREGKPATRVAVFGSASFLTNRDLRQGSHLSLLHNTLWWLLGQEELVSVRAPEDVERNVRFDVEGSVRRLLNWTLLGIIPACAVLMGLAAFVIRRK